MNTAAAQSQTLKAILGLRGMIVDGEIGPGARVSEPLITERFGVSRTPARAALVQMSEEGLLERRPSGGFVVSTFTETDIYQAIEIRGTLEGLAARYAAEGSPATSLLDEMDACVRELDHVVERLDQMVDQDDYIKPNDRFHSLLIEASGSIMVARSLEKIKALPFAAANAFVKSLSLNKPAVRRILTVAQEQHREIVKAIRQKKGTRAQALAHEHSFCAARYLQLLKAHEQPIPWVTTESNGG